MPADRLALPAFAKINLSLELLGRRRDGYTEIRTVYQTVTLHDRLRLRLTRTGKVEVRVPGGGAPSGRGNLVYRLLTQARRELGLRRGVEVELEKNIPVARGLGGGSSDAAAALLGLLRLVRVRLSWEELCGLGRRVGADVPLFFCGGRALGVGRGDEVYPLADRQPTFCVLLCPPQAIPTALAYRWAARARAPLTLSRRRAIMTGRRVAANEPWAAGNDFEPVVFSRFPELGRMKAALLGAGALEAGLSGSGSTLYGLFAQRAAARRAAARWARAASVVVAETLPRERYRRALRLTDVLR
jgi:4-diphosphocytidyl-2-C-methyl-D-erythritol kinase